MAKKLTFEEAMARLETITRELETDDISLEESLKKFDEGMRLATLCSKQLEEAQQKVSLLLEKNGVLEAGPFSEPDTSE